MRLSSAKRDAAVIGAAVLAGAVLLYPGALLRGELFFERDLNFDWYLRLAAVARAAAERALPLWDPGVTFGQPLLADPGTQVLYPTTWLGLVLPRAAGYTAFVLVHLLVAAVGASRLARAWGATRLGAALAGIAWAFCGPVQSLVNLRQHLAGAAWMPWALLAAEEVALSPGFGSGIRLTAVLGAQVLAGSADVCAMTWALALTWVLVRARAIRRRRGRRLAGAGVTAVAAGAVALLATAVVWMPALDVLSRSPRRDLAADLREAWSVPLPGLARLAVPLDPARVGPVADARLALYDRPDTPFLFSLYLGAPLLGLAAAALGARPRPRAVGFLLVVAAVAVAVALGPHAPFYPLAAKLLPALRILRYPSKAFVAFSLAAALLAGLGCSAVQRGRRRRALGIGLALALALAVPLVWRASLHYGPVPATASAAAAAAAAGVLAAHALSAVRRGLAAAALAGVCLADLAAAHAGLHATAPETVFFTPPALLSVVDRAEGRRLYVYDYTTLPSSPAKLGRANPYPTIEPPPGWDPRAFTVAALQSYLLPPWAALLGAAPAFEFDMRGLYSRDLNDLTFFLRRVEGSPAHERLLAMAGVGTVASLHQAGLEGLVPAARLPSVFPEPIFVWRVPGVPLRTRVVGCARDADARTAFEALGAPGFDPSAEAIVASPPPGLGPCGEAGRSRLAFEGADRARLEVEAWRPALVVLADTWDPGWRASVDGRPADLLRANVTFRAVAIPAGRHVVEMVYRPRAAWLGLVISLASLAVATIAVIARWRRPR